MAITGIVAFAVALKWVSGESAPTRAPEPVPKVSDAGPARGSELTLLFRPSLRARVEKELPAGHAANIPALVQVIGRLKPIATAHPGQGHPATRPWEPAVTYDPTDDELLLSLAGDRIWRALQLAPPGTLAKVRADNPGWVDAAVEYPQIEIVRVDVAGSGPALFAGPPVVRRVSLKESRP